MSNATPIVCPKCGNTDLEEMHLYLTNLSTERYYFIGLDDDKSPVFEWGKSVCSEDYEGTEPTMECEKEVEGARYGRCYAQWNVSWDDFDIG